MVTETSKRPAFPKRRKYFIYLLGFGIFLVLFAFLFYRILVGQAFADRGQAENVVPRLFTSSDQSGKSEFLESVQERFKCSQRHKIDLAHFNSVGMFPFILKNSPDTCNRAADFVGYDRFIDAMLHGEEHLGIPAKSSKSTSYDHHHPGLEILKGILEKGQKYDRSVEFYWWMFPVPMGIPNRGFAYAIFQGDLKGLRNAAYSRNLNFDNLFLEGVKVFMTFQGWDIENSQIIKDFDYDERDHIVTKAWISLKCFSEYEQNALMSKYKNNLESFMKLKNIRYPADFPCK